MIVPSISRTALKSRRALTEAEVQIHYAALPEDRIDGRLEMEEVEERQRGRASVTAFLTPKEKAAVQRKAMELNMPMSAFLKQCLGACIDQKWDPYETAESFITLQEFADYIHVSRSKARDICLANEIDFYRLDGRNYRIRKRDAEEYLEKTRVQRKVIDESFEPLLTVQDVASKYRVTPQTVDQWIRKGKMKAQRIDGKHIRIRVEDSDSMLSIYGATS